MITLAEIDALTGCRLGSFDVLCPRLGIEATLRGGRR
jgi:hypothetical protein